jgi:hypothetical protein
VEDQYVQAEAEEDSVQMDAPAQTESRLETAGNPADDVDKKDLENRIWTILENQQRRSAERLGG